MSKSTQKHPNVMTASQSNQKKIVELANKEFQKVSEMSVHNEPIEQTP